MRKFLLLATGLMASTIAAPSALSQLPDAIGAKEIEDLARGRTWAIAFVGNPDNPQTTAVWNFRGNGTLCARAAGEPGDSKCADEGKWAVKDNTICWDLTWLGGAYGLKNACSLIVKGEKGQFELRGGKTPLVRSGLFKVM